MAMPLWRRVQQLLCQRAAVAAAACSPGRAMQFPPAASPQPAPTAGAARARADETSQRKRAPLCRQSKQLPAKHPPFL
jgi:hypothetical protein